MLLFNMHSKAISTNSWITKILDFTVVIITSRTNSGRTAFMTHSTSPLFTEICHGTIFVSFLYIVARSSGIRFIVSCDADLISCGSFWDLLVPFFSVYYCQGAPLPVHNIILVGSDQVLYVVYL